MLVNQAHDVTHNFAEVMTPRLSKIALQALAIGVRHATARVYQHRAGDYHIEIYSGEVWHRLTCEEFEQMAEITYNALMEVSHGTH